MKDLLIIDFDDTIFMKDDINNEVYFKLKQLNSDFDIVISTKRSVNSFFELMDKMEVSKYVKALSFNSGCTIIINGNTYNKCIDRDIFCNFVEKLCREESFIITTILGKRYDIDYYVKSGKTEDIYEIDYYGKDYIYLSTIINYCSCNNLSVLLDISHDSNNFSLKIFPNNTNKLSVLDYICTENKKVYAIGDSFIDTPFILTINVIGYINGISDFKEIKDLKLNKLVKYLFRI